MSRTAALVPAVSLALLFLVSPAPAVPLDPGHPVYPFLRRLELEGRIAPGRLSTLPIAKSEAAAMLEEAARAAGGSESLPAWERRRLDAFREEFGGLEGRDGRFHRLGFRDSAFRVQVGAESFNAGYVADSVPKARTYGFGALSAKAEGDFKGRLQFLSYANAGQERSVHERFTENYDPARGMPYNTDRTGKAGVPRGAGTFDAFRTVVGYEQPALRIEFGSDWNQWGPGIWQHATLSSHPWFWVQDSLAPNDSNGFKGTPNPGRYRDGYRRPGESAPMTQARIAVRAGRFAYTKIVAQRTGLWTDSVAYLIAHRLEWRPWDRLGLALSEMVATGNRPLDWTYAIPLVPLKYAEHELGDRDNTGLSADFEALLPGRVRIFGELFLDDWSGWDLDYWGDKYAFSLGGEAADIALPGSLLRMEYARVEPWVFTHSKPGRQYQHFGALLGSSLPPDSHSLRAAWEQALGADLDARLEYAFMQRNAVDRGTSVFDTHSDAVDGPTKEFLGGVVETRNAIAVGGSWRWRRFLSFDAAAGWVWVEDWKSRPGVSLSAPTLSGELTLRY
jgi:hypothetical protein